MQTIIKVSNRFAQRNALYVLAFARNLVILMTGNINYTTPVPALALITTAADALAAAITAALNGGRLEIAARDAALRDLLALLRQLGSYVQTHCQNDLLILLSSGFEAQRSPTPIGTLPPPQNVRVSSTATEGELYLLMRRVPGALNYTVQTAAAADGPYTTYGLTSSTRSNLSGLTSGKTCWVRVCANGTAGPSGWGGPASAMPN